MKNHISIELLADILSVSKNSIESRIKKGELIPTPTTNLIPLKQVNHLPEFQNLNNSKWEEESNITPNRNYTMVELFAGGGGLALGMERAGFNSVLLNEFDKDSCATLRYNRPNWNVVHDDIANLDFTQYRDKVDVVTGGFPCQAFSYAGNRLGLEDTRGTLFFEMARAINEIKPKMFLAENVKALLNHDGGKTLEVIRDVVDEIGYVLLEPKLMKAIFYKVPQKRERVILIGIRKDLIESVDFQWPSTYHKVFTMEDVLYAGDLFPTDVPESIGQTYPKRKKEIMEHVPQGGYWRDLPENLQREYMKKSFYSGGGKTGMARRLSLGQPSLTLTCSPSQKQTERCHPTETRPLQTREYARIQTFPDDWHFCGSMTSIYRQIGNAVPVNMAEALGRALIRTLNKLEEK